MKKPSVFRHEESSNGEKTSTSSSTTTYPYVYIYTKHSCVKQNDTKIIHSYDIHALL
jgi:hypothetical protein